MIKISNFCLWANPILYLPFHQHEDHWSKPDIHGIQDLFVWVDCHGKNTEWLPLFFAGNFDSVWCDMFSAQKMEKKTLFFSALMNVRVRPPRQNLFFHGVFPLLRTMHKQATMHRCFKMGNVSCRIISDTFLFICKIHVSAVSMACHCRIHAASRHHRLWLMITHGYAWFLHFAADVSDDCSWL